MQLKLNLQIIEKQYYIPTKKLFLKWINAVLKKEIQAKELNIRIVSNDEMIFLNETYRKKKGSTNVLSFSYDKDNNFIVDEDYLLGDIIICADVVDKESKEKNIPLEEHWAHMVIHGVLHLLGSNHETDDQADKMEYTENHILAKLGYGKR